MKKLKFIAIVFCVISLCLAACSSSVEVGSDDQSAANQEESVSTSPDNNESEETEESAQSADQEEASVPSDDDENEEAKFAYRFADREEGISLLLGNTEFFNNLNQNDMDYRVQKKGATLEEVQEFTAEQVLEFSEEEKQGIAKSMSAVESILRENGYVLPETDEIVFVKTTQLEECGADAYTHKTEIYYGDGPMEMLLSDDEEAQREANELMCHEIFHCLTRNNPQFREAMYGIIGFTAQDEDFELGPEVRELAFSNPDVDHRNSYATFTINGEEMDCFPVCMVEPFEKEGEDYVRFTEHMMYTLVPVNDTNTYYSVLGDEELFNAYFDVFGRNTTYAFDPEECMAENFAYAIVDGKDGREGEPYKNPEIIEGIIDYIKK